MESAPMEVAPMDSNAMESLEVPQASPASPTSPAEARLSLSTLGECLPTEAAQAADGAGPSPAPSSDCGCSSGRSPGPDAVNEHESSGSPSFQPSASPTLQVELLIENLPRQGRPRRHSVMSDDTVMLDTDDRDGSPTTTPRPTVAGIVPIVPIDLVTVTVTSTSADGEPAQPESPLEVITLEEPPAAEVTASGSTPTEADNSGHALVSSPRGSTTASESSPQGSAAAGLWNGHHPGTPPSLFRRQRHAAKRSSLDRGGSSRSSSRSSSSCEPPDAAGPSQAPSTSRQRKKSQRKRSSASAPAPGSLPQCWVLVKRCDE